MGIENRSYDRNTDPSVFDINEESVEIEELNIFPVLDTLSQAAEIDVYDLRKLAIEQSQILRRGLENVKYTHKSNGPEGKNVKGGL